MNYITKVLLTVVIPVFSAAGCTRTSTIMLQNGIDSIGTFFVPDKREGIFRAELIRKGSASVLTGETDIPEAKEAIKSFLKAQGVEYSDSLVVLPDTNNITKPWGLVNVSVCNLRAETDYTSELVSQALMGTPVRLIRVDDGWIQVQTPDRYLGWVDRDVIVALTPDEHKRWKSSKRVIYMKKTGDVFSTIPEKQVISDIVAGCILEVISADKADFVVRLPDGRNGWIKGSEGILLEELETDHYLKPENLISTAVSFTGIPYLWGGTSPKGFDCSGFVKTVYFLNGVILARDVSLQFRHGIRLTRESYPDSLLAGDLLFFGSVRDGKPRATHVGIYTENGKFIHASGMVKINSLDSTSADFSRYRRDSFLGVIRIIGAKQDNGIRAVPDHDWYK